MSITLTVASVYSQRQFRGILFPPGSRPHFSVVDWWRWPLWLVGFDFPLSFWTALLQQLGILSILSCFAGLILFWLFFFPLKGCQENLPLTIGWLKVSCVWKLFLRYPPFLRRVLLISAINRNPALGIWVAGEHRRKCCSYRKCPQGGSIIQVYLWFLG